MWALLNAAVAKKMDFKNNGKPALEGGTKSLRANVQWGEKTTHKVADPDRLR